MKQKIKHVTVSALPKLFKEIGVTRREVGVEKMNMIVAGCELQTLTADDVAYMADPSTTADKANARLAKCRREVL